MPGKFNEAARLLGGIKNETVGSLENVLPASKAQVRIENAKLQAEVVNLQAENANLQAEVTEDRALLNTVISQVNKLTPVSMNTVVPNMVPGCRWCV